MNWAGTCGNLGNALYLIGAIRRDAETIERGIATIEDALAVFYEAGAAGYAEIFNTMLITAREQLAALRPDASPTS